MIFQSVLKYSNDKAKLFSSSSRAVVKTCISDGDFVPQNVIKMVMERVEVIDFTPHGYKLEKEHGWSEEKINHAIEVYKEWLVLQVCYEEFSFAPSELIDEFWHAHILDTRKYMDDCNTIKGEFIHHYPYFGITEQENEFVLESGFELTKKLYMKHFGHVALGFNENHAASCGCCSGNGSSCR